MLCERSHRVTFYVYLHVFVFRNLPDVLDQTSSSKFAETVCAVPIDTGPQPLMADRNGCHSQRREARPSALLACRQCKNNDQNIKLDMKAKDRFDLDTNLRGVKKLTRVFNV